MLKRKSWEDMGRSLAAQTTLFTLARDTLKGIGVGPEIIPWMNGAGRDIAAGAIHELGKKFLRERVVRPGQTPDSVLVNVGWQADSAGRQKQKWVEVRRQNRDVYIGTRLVHLKQDPRQLTGGHVDEEISGYTVTQGLMGLLPLHPIYIKAFLEYPELVPGSWKFDGRGLIKQIFFWRELGKDSQGEYADGFHWNDGVAVETRHHLRFRWDYVHYSAMVESTPVYELEFA